MGSDEWSALSLPSRYNAIRPESERVFSILVILVKKAPALSSGEVSLLIDKAGALSYGRCMWGPDSVPSDSAGPFLSLNEYISLSCYPVMNDSIPRGVTRT
ncbi:MAG: hypothetical protein AUJ92_05755 [Armatimonadetes bacterium CG2_30_59_28]|nr:MAG: hypothetical protein AUJ92_05755 [Armatimonadetes bacterium CG2_30_59_28]PIU64319.1 MAG: hypothetical protein COS85_12985 [Armatimonadetes bacterium CG07_land_8_20_14_0_80_59_28]PIX41255.1 MAG: hypothetical protein COZ56_12525 [Armatimonadetes bacterium CG_4_8_14_3_um_filter_58_9]PIY40879.1 MAG: hypothetical protein COZ05_16570 [Armatimonadetes bacterium CG_4_10_14_3_um_filter_59_10]PJB66110.1 MAG: hypothetical protein CO095_13375 [Armatimonadetes bacterium CG_4_9_14_3_um_filter_58_7]